MTEQRPPDRVTETDVLVVGASASGVCAAVQAARMGCEVVLTEPTGWVGGMLTAAGVSAIDGNHSLPAGLWGEFRDALRDHYGGAAALETGWVSNTLFDPRVGHRILRSWIEALPTLRLLPRRRLLAVTRHADRIRGARFASTRRTEEIRATVTVLADEYGDGVAAAGLRWRTGLESRAETGEPEAPERPHRFPQDLTWAATVALPPSGFAAGRRGPVFAPDDELADLLADPPVTWDRFFDYGRLPGDLAMLNWPGQDVCGDYLDPACRPRVLHRAREKTARLITALDRAFGPESIRTPRIYPGGSLALIPYIREARRIDAIETLTTRDLVLPGSPPPATAVAVGDYPLDHHRRFDASAPAIRFPAITAFSVPYGTLVPAGCDGVLVAEKSIGVSGLVNGCTRLQPVVMQIGQAAGAAAAICARGAIDPRNVDPEALQDTLLDANGLLVAASDVRCGDPGFRALQRAAVDGWLELRHVSGGWANRARLDPDEPVTRRTVAACRERTHARPGGRPGHDRLHRALEDAERAITEGGSVTRRELAVRVMAARSG